MSLSATTRINSLKNQVTQQKVLVISSDWYRTDKSFHCNTSLCFADDHSKQVFIILFFFFFKYFRLKTEVFIQMYENFGFPNCFLDRCFLTFQGIHIEARLCIKLCPPATLVLHMLFLCLSFSAFLFCLFLSLHCFLFSLLCFVLFCRFKVW